MKALPRWLSGKESACQCRRCRFHPGWERSPGGRKATHSSVLAWEILWTEKPCGYGSWDPSELDTIDQLTHSFIHISYFAKLISEIVG